MWKRLVLCAALMAAALAGHAQNAGSNVAVQLLASAARTSTTVNTTDQTNTEWTKAHIIINVSARTSGTYTPTIQGKDPVSGNYYTLLTGPAISATGMTILKVGPGLVPLANASAADILPRSWRVTLAGTSTPIMTFSVGAFLE